MPQVPADPAGTSAPPRANATVAVLALAGIVASLMQTIVIPLVPKLPELLGASVADTAWVVTVTLLAGAVVTPVAGRLGDMYGKRRMLVVSLVSLVAGSTICALSDTLAPLLVGRTLQGLAAGVILAQMTVSFGPVTAPSANSFRVIMAIGAGAAIVALALAAFIPGRRQSATVPAESHTTAAVSSSRSFP